MWKRVRGKGSRMIAAQLLAYYFTELKDDQVKKVSLVCLHLCNSITVCVWQPVFIEVTGFSPTINARTLPNYSIKERRRICVVRHVSLSVSEWNRAYCSVVFVPAQQRFFFCAFPHGQVRRDERHTVCRKMRKEAWHTCAQLILMQVFCEVKRKRWVDRQEQEAKLVGGFSSEVFRNIVLWPHKKIKTTLSISLTVARHRTTQKALRLLRCEH